jgi:hypothetical protein|tara:strand:+ start:1354 stop:1473 length:120 start_codon:yes stop_codon:yes gene_type:complete
MCSLRAAIHLAQALGQLLGCSALLLKSLPQSEVTASCWE